MLFADPSYVRSGVRTYRRSSWDRTGGNSDWLNIEPGQTVVLLDEQGPGKVTHMYWTTINAGVFHFRQLVLRAWWDGEAEPSVEVPVGDLFCVPHSMPVPVSSLGAVVNPGSDQGVSWGLNLYLPMPFASSARIELSHDVIPGVSAHATRFWYHIELEKYEAPLPEETGRFHAQWRRENPTIAKPGVETNAPGWQGANVDGTENYVALEAEGRGQMVGLHLQVDNLGGGWYGEGDDMIFVDGYPGSQWPPTYHGTGSEEVFGGGAGPNQAYDGPYTGFHMVESPDYSGRNAMYRWFLVDPIHFERSLVWTIEHGHDNNYENDYTSVAYWYQFEPHKAFPSLPDVMGRLPRFSEGVLQAEDARVRARGKLRGLGDAGVSREVRLPLSLQFSSGCKALLEGRHEEALAVFEAVLEAKV